MVNKARWIEATAEHGPRQEARGHQRHPRRVATAPACASSSSSSATPTIRSSSTTCTSTRRCRASFGVNMLAIVDGRPVLLDAARRAAGLHRAPPRGRHAPHAVRSARGARAPRDRRGPRPRGHEHRSRHRDHPLVEGHRRRQGPPDGRAARRARRLPRARRPPAGRGRRRRAPPGFVNLTDRQAQAILDMRLGRLTGLEREKLEAEYKELWALTDYLEGLLADEKKLMARDHRRAARRSATSTPTSAAPRSSTPRARSCTEALIDQEDMVVTRTHLGYVKRTPVSRVRGAGPRRPRHHRRRVGRRRRLRRRHVRRVDARPPAAVHRQGPRLLQEGATSCPRARAPRRASPFVNVLELQDGEQVVAMLPLTGVPRRTRYVFFATQSGTVKKTELDAVRRTIRPDRHQRDHDRRRRPPGRRRAHHDGRDDVLLTIRERLRGPLPRGPGPPDGPHRRRRARHHACARATASSAW